MMIDLLPDERIDDLQCKGHQIIQNPNMFCFGMDAVLLANFVKHRRDGMYMDLGTGTGIPLHSTSFDFEEDLLLSGFALYKALLTR